MKMILPCQCLFNKLIQHGLQIRGGMGFQFSTEGFSGSPESAQNHLGDSKLTLCAQSLESQIRGDSFISQGIYFGGSLVQYLVTLNLGFLTRQVLRQLHGIHRICGLGVDTVDLAA